MALQAVLSTSTDPWFNLALEHYLGHRIQPGDHVFYWWQNRPSVIVGYFQDAWAECWAERLRQDHVDLVRRPTGGGAVYHDLGNSNFSFWDSTAQGKANPLTDPLIAGHFAAIKDALQAFNIQIFTYGRNDLGLLDRGVRYKVSGNAFAYHPGRVLHHGTLLRQVDFSRMQNYLRPHRLKRRGVGSHPQLVMNLHQLNPQITHVNLGQVIKEKWEQRFTRADDRSGLVTTAADSSAAIAWVSYGPADLPRLLALGEDLFPYARWTSPAWNWGQQHHFAQELAFRFSFGLFTILAEVDEQHRVQDAVIYSDTLHPTLVPAWQKNLAGCLWQPAAVLQRFPASKLLPAQREEVARLGPEGLAPDMSFIPPRPAEENPRTT